LGYAAPDYLSLTSTRHVLTSDASSTSATAEFGRLGPGDVSLGTEVWFFSCCDADGDGTSGDCAQYVDLPVVVSAGDSTDDRVSAAVALTAEGADFVDAVGLPPTDDLDVALYAYSYGELGGMQPVVDCSTVEGGGGFPDEVVAYDSLELALRHSEAGQ
jgi:hypothetical protein